MSESRLLTVLACVLFQTFLVEAQTTEVLPESTILGRYILSNSQQCRRLCWYRKLCTAYSYREQDTSLPVCVLFAEPKNESAFAIETTRKEATKGNVNNSCADRPCAETEVCVPASSSNEGHRCLPLPPADCGVPCPVRNGSFDWSGTQQGNVANLTCDNEFALFPEGASGQLTCHVTSQWIPVGVTCKYTRCDNGGTHDGTRCVCPLQHRGDRCREYIRDCSEAYENGYNNTGLNGLYLIQPNTSPAPFKVYCKLEWGGITYPMRRQIPSIQSYNVSWTTAKSGVTSHLTQNLDNGKADFFVGLENLHHLTAQAVYRLHVNLVQLGTNVTKSGYFYDGFVIGNESTDYTLSYKTCLPRNNSGDVVSDNGFNGSPPMTFHTQDRDTNNCTGTKGAAGWYGTDCNGNTFFGDDKLVWPVNGSDWNWTIVEVIVERRTPLYEFPLNG
ncbi:uncharacterized protein [Littorina saxatilis]|uniref:Fibrinogen C-terminal domain-containing protein n=1 Tax=Littorina saxatilis TaxID=31220 RepID=A0AAN9BG73_9CAEN